MSAPACSTCGCQLLPDADGKILRARKLPCHPRHVYVQVLVVYGFYYHILHYIAKGLGIKYKTCFRIWLAFYRYMQLIVMSMPVFISTFAKHFAVVCPRPKRDYSAYARH